MRTDIHHPSVIIPSDYEYVAVWTMNIEGLGDCEFILREREIVRAHMARTGGEYARVETSGSCQVCGNVRAIYLALFYHAKSNTYVRVGFDCERKLGMSGDEAAFNLFRRNVQDARESVAGKRKAIAILADAGLSQAWDIYAVDRQATDWQQYEERTIDDIVSKLVKYGSLSEKQLEFVRKLIARIDNRPIIAAQRAAEREAAAPCPTGRVRITGVVVGTKVVEDRFDRFSGERTCIIVKDNTGFKVYGSRFDNVSKGDAVDFTATVTPSQDDNKFGFFKRPRPYVDPAIAKITKPFTKKELAAIAW